MSTSVKNLNSVSVEKEEHPWKDLYDKFMKLNLWQKIITIGIILGLLIFAMVSCSQEENKTIKLPNLVGMNYSDAENNLEKLSSDFNIVQKDVTPDNRSIFIKSNWIICSQQPEANVEVHKKENIYLTYGRDKNECDTKKVAAPTVSQSTAKTEENKTTSTTAPAPKKEASKYQERKTADGLTEITASSTCSEFFNNKYGDVYHLESLIGVRYKDIVDYGDGLGEEWQFNIDYKAKKTSEKGVFICRVGGTEDKPVVDDYALNRTN